MGLDLGRSSDQGWTSEQQKALSIIPHVTGSLSILGSAFIIYDVLSDRKKWSSTYNRILFAMGIIDFMASWAFVFSTVPMPDDTQNVYVAIGNGATCTTQGFFVNFNIASPMYNFSLAIYFLLMVTFRWSKHNIKTKVEPWLHGVPIFWTLSTTFIVLAQGGFNESALWCWVASYPLGCHKDDTCTRCPLCTVYYRWFFFFGPLWAAAFGTMVVMSMLVYDVRKTEKKSERWIMKSSSTPIAQNKSPINDADDSLPALEEPTTTANTVGREGTPKGTEETKAKRKALKTTHNVTGQAFRYCIVFWITWFPATVNRVSQLVLGKSFFWLMLLHVIFTPMQGFWNFLVYIYLRARKYSKEKKKARCRARAIEALKTQHGNSYNPSVHTLPKDVDNDNDEFDENDL